MSAFYVIIARINICSRIFGGTCPPVSYAYVDRQYKRHYAAQKKGSQDKQKLTSGPQTVKTHIKSFFAFSFFAFYTCFRTSISQIQFRILYVFALSNFRTSHFIHAPFIRLCTSYRLFQLRVGSSETQ